MSVTIDSVIVGGVEDRRLVLSNSQAARVIDIGTNWTKLRIGYRISMTDTGANLSGTPLLFIGALASPTANLSNGPLTTNTSHFVGFISATAGWTRVAGPPVSYLIANTSGNIYAKKVVNTITRVAGTAITHIVPAYPLTDARVFGMVEITKGSPNFTIGMLTCHQATAPQTDAADKQKLIDAMGMTSMDAAATYLDAASTNYQGTSTGALAVDEATDGFLNAVCVAWNQSVPVMQFSDLFWAKMA